MYHKPQLCTIIFITVLTSKLGPVNLNFVFDVHFLPNILNCTASLCCLIFSCYVSVLTSGVALAGKNAYSEQLITKYGRH